MVAVAQHKGIGDILAGGLSEKVTFASRHLRLAANLLSLSHTNVSFLADLTA